MGREIRRVPANWEHPRKDGEYVPLHDRGYAIHVAEWDRECVEWNTGIRPDYAKDVGDMSYVEWAGERPVESDYMPQWPDAERTHYQIYESTTEGTPLSPVFATPEDAARYCADNGVSWFGSRTATYEQWLAIAKGGHDVLVVTCDGKIRSEVLGP